MNPTQLPDGSPQSTDSSMFPQLSPQAWAIVEEMARTCPSLRYPFLPMHEAWLLTAQAKHRPLGHEASEAPPCAPPG